MATPPQSHGNSPQAGGGLALQPISNATATQATMSGGHQSNGSSVSITRKQDKKGYPDLSRFMALDDGMLQFKRFAELNAHSLLMQQAEILVLEEDLKACANANRQDFGTKYDTRVEELMELNSKNEHSEQWKLVLQIRTRLKDYNEALLLQSQLYKLSQPRKYDTKQLQEWLKREKGGYNFLEGVERFAWHPDQQHDLLAITQEPFDALTGWLAETAVPWFTRVRQKTPFIKKKLVKGHEELGLVDHSDRKYRITSRAVIVLFSAFTPSIAILILSYIRNILARILAAMGMSLVFAVSLASATEVRPAEVFGATSAFAAVQVVFIGSNNITQS